MVVPTTPPLADSPTQADQERLELGQAGKHWIWHFAAILRHVIQNKGMMN